jgi:hypothetical protein
VSELCEPEFVGSVELRKKGTAEQISRECPNGNRWECAGGGVLLKDLQRCFHLFISHRHHLLIL